MSFVYRIIFALIICLSQVSVGHANKTKRLDTPINEKLTIYNFETFLNATAKDYGETGRFKKTECDNPLIFNCRYDRDDGVFFVAEAFNMRAMNAMRRKEEPNMPTASHQRSLPVTQFSFFYPKPNNISDFEFAERLLPIAKIATELATGDADFYENHKTFLRTFGVAFAKPDKSHEFNVDGYRFVATFYRGNWYGLFEKVEYR